MEAITKQPNSLYIFGSGPRWSAPGIDLEIRDGRLFVYAGENEDSGDCLFSAEDTPDVLLAIQAWIENLTNKGAQNADKPK